MVDITRRSVVGLMAALPLLSGPGRAFAETLPTRPESPSSEVCLNFNENPWGPSASACKAMEQGIALSGRYPYRFQYQLVALLARQLAIPEEHIDIYAGSKVALQQAVMAFTGPRSLVMATPSYEAPRLAAEAHQATVHEVPLTAGHAHDIGAMLAADPQFGVIYICNPNNPTGTLTPIEQIERALKDKPAGALVVVDEAYIHYCDAPSCVSLVKDHSDLLVLRTFSKIYGMAGARLGFAVGQPALLERLNVLGEQNVAAASSLLGAIASLEDRTLLSERKLANARTREQSMAWFRDRGFACTAAQGNFFMVNLGRPADVIAEGLAQRGVRVGRIWQDWPNWLRITVGKDEEMARLRNAFAVVALPGKH
ncbi:MULTISPECIES: pyoverdine biosynthesis transaminase PtaA [Pseudomonas]|uniref:Pyridoxal phosphate-dependent aminotransferase n=1 Tax=Pseudomonas gingeri TaxID=117681 RepID=A0A7Y7WBP4_9PSED|nr:MULTISPECIES: pyridoxal phosphate-dependent aminotransferase [Pseudomonas]MCU1738369.1 pyridoxal phosphate-dependent aminotransferase [Pseudomonas sp. 20S_6.2_Bac1]NWB46430.1 pyridoxal phosphate-dependent aminotransferase [Pseudomonas gingeri]